jgi:hypothetical protein
MAKFGSVYHRPSARALDNVDGLAGRHTAFVTTKPFRTPPHPISEDDLIAGG